MASLAVVAAQFKSGHAGPRQALTGFVSTNTKGAPKTLDLMKLKLAEEKSQLVSWTSACYKPLRLFTPIEALTEYYLLGSP